MGQFKRFLAFVRSIDLTALGKTALSSIGGVWGWVAGFLGGFLLKLVEAFLDQQIKRAEDAIEIKEEDKRIEEKAKENAEKIKTAQTDEELDDAFRNSLK